MAFNANKFTKQEFEPRTKEIPVPGLKHWFDEGDQAVWVVRGLEGNELALSREAAEKNKNIAAVLEALVSSNQPEKVAAMKELLGTSDKVCDDLAKRLEQLVLGSVAPTITMDIAVKLAKNFPIEFMNITQTILLLTGLGSNMVKPKPSGKTSQLETA